MVEKGQTFRFLEPVRTVAVKRVQGGFMWFAPAEGQPFVAEAFGMSLMLFPFEEWTVTEAYIGIDGSWVVVASGTLREMEVHFKQHHPNPGLPYRHDPDPSNPLYLEVEVLEREQ